MRALWRRFLPRVLFSASVLLIAGELLARIVLPLLPAPPGTPWIHDPVVGYRLHPSEPGLYDELDDRHINAMGFRDRSHTRLPRTGWRRVIGIGDSFVYGAVPIEQNFLRVAQRSLIARGDSTEVVLMGCPGYSGENEAAVLVEYALPMQPDHIVLNFFVGNDVTGLRVRGEVIRGRMFYTESPIPTLNFLRKSRLWVMIESVAVRGTTRWLRRRESTATPTPASTLDNEVHVAVDDLYLRIMDGNIKVFEREMSARVREDWRLAEAALHDFDSSCDAAGVPWTLLIIPSEVQVDPDVRTQVLNGLQLDAASMDFDYPQRRLHIFARERGVAVIDPLEALRAVHQPNRRLYVPNDTHWNERGNAVAGSMLADELANLR